MRHVGVGDDLRIPATTWNALVSLLEHSEGSGQKVKKGFRNTVECLVRNDTGADLPQFGVVGLSAPLILPSDNETEFLRRIVMSGVLATGGDYDLRWGLTVAPIAAGAIGTVVVQGLCYAKVGDYTLTATPANDGNVNTLAAADCGLARVLWRNTGDGAQWAIVCLG